MEVKSVSEGRELKAVIHKGTVYLRLTDHQLQGHGVGCITPAGTISPCTGFKTLEEVEKYFVKVECVYKGGEVSATI